MTQNRDGNDMKSGEESESSENTEWMGLSREPTQWIQRRHVPCIDATQPQPPTGAFIPVRRKRVERLLLRCSSWALRSESVLFQGFSLNLTPQFKSSKVH